MAVVQFDIFIGLVLPIVYGPQGMVHCVDNVFLSNIYIASQRSSNS